MLLVRALAVVIAALALGGCGGPGPAVEAGAGRVDLVLDDYLIRPQHVRARAGQLAFDVVNRGRLGHNFRVRGRGGEPVAIATLLPGESGSETVTLRPGDYKMLCTVANHEQLGMYGRLVVR
jgi:plastocyanin